MFIKTLSLGCCVANSYIFSLDGKNAVIVDVPDNGDVIYNEVISRGFELCAVLLTHGHFDHIYGLKYLYRILEEKGKDIPLYIHKNEEFFLRDTSHNLSSSLFGIPFKFEKKAHTVTEGETINIAGKAIKVISTPGHTPGSVCYYIEDENVLFTGDTLFGGTVGRTDFPGGDMSVLYTSLEKLKKLPDNTEIYPGHNGMTTLLREKKYNEYLC